MIKRVFLTFLLLVLSSFVFSQNISKKYAEKLYYEKKFQESKEILDQVLKANPMDGVAYMDRAAVRMELNELDEALEDINYVLSKTPLYPSAYNQRGYIYLLLKDYRNAYEKQE